MHLLDTASVRQYAEGVYIGVDFQADLRRGHLARDPFVKGVCSAIRADLCERFPEKVFTFPKDSLFRRFVRFVLQNKPGVQPIQLSCVDKPRAAKAQGQKRQLVDSSSEEEGACGSGEKGNSPPSAQEERSPGAQSQSPTPLPKGRRGQGASGGGQMESPPPATGESSPGTRSRAPLLKRIAALEQELEKKEAANAALEARVLQFEGLFRIIRKPTRGTSGSAETFSPALQAISLEAMAGGAFADHVRVVLESLARNLEMLPDSGHRVPRTNWFTQLRAKQEGLLKKQRDQFLAPENGPFMPSFDATSLGQHSTLALGE